jgi:hypothetical protein
MSWDGEERRHTATRRQVNRNLVILLISIVALVVFASAFSSSRRQADVLKIACGSAHGHRELTIAVEAAAEQTNRIAADLGLPIEPVMIRVPEIPDECDGVT